MTYKKYIWEDIEAVASVSSFLKEGKTTEAHAIIQIERNEEHFDVQFSRLQEAASRLLCEAEYAVLAPVFKRYFLSDAVNQAHHIPTDYTPCSVSYIQQPPLEGGKVALWIYMQSRTSMTCKHDFTIVQNNGYEHLWRMGMTNSEGDSHEQTERLLNEYEQKLNLLGANMHDHCIRTWFFVRDVDLQYRGLVDARRDFFDRIGLTSTTHYIASTGIGGMSGDRKAIHQLGTYAVKGLKEEQITYLQAASNMNRTSDYGVTFERGTRVSYGDRNHIFVSGTASIDNKGQVLYNGDIRKQTERMWQNVEAVLSEGGACFSDVMQIIVYLRDLADAPLVKKLFEEKFPATPHLITLAPVCRPEWLIEMECIAISDADNKYNDY